MKKFFSLLVALMLLAACSQIDVPAPGLELEAQGSKDVRRVILDTDFGFDVDDVGALVVLHELADEGYVKLLGVNSVVCDPYTPGAIDAINTYYGRPNVPVGQNKDCPSNWYRAKPFWGSYDSFNDDIYHRYKRSVSGRNVPGAVATYRKILASQPDKSVTIAQVGFSENIAELLQSGPDKYSKLNGKQLVAKKVRELVIQGGRSNTDDFNLSDMGRSNKDSNYVREHWPEGTRLVFQGSNVCKYVHTTVERGVGGFAYDRFGVSKRPSYDPCVALRAGVGTLHKGQRIFRDKEGYMWYLDGAGKARVKFTSNDDRLESFNYLGERGMEQYLDALMN